MFIILKCFENLKYTGQNKITEFHHLRAEPRVEFLGFSFSFSAFLSLFSSVIPSFLPSFQQNWCRFVYKIFYSFVFIYLYPESFLNSLEHKSIIKIFITFLLKSSRFI